jgi:hypothetical protein
MGIGVPDISGMGMEAFYRASRETRAPFEEGRARRERAQERRREDYQTFVENLPTYEGLNAKVTAEMRQDVEKMRELAEQKMLTGPFFAMAKTEEGRSAEAELSRMGKDIIDKGARYEAIESRVGQQLQFAADPVNQEKINQKRTQKRIDEYQKAKSLDEIEAATAQPLVVMKPDPQDLFGYVGKIINRIKDIGGMSESATYEADKTTGLYKIKTEEDYDANSIHENFVQGYRDATPEMRDYIDESYEEAVDKETPEGVTMSPEDWFANKYSGLFGKRVTEKVEKMPTQKAAKYQYGSGLKRTPEGRIVIDDIKKPTVQGASVKRSTTKVRKERKGEKIYFKDPSVKEGQRAEVAYNTAEIPLVGLDEPFGMLTQQGSRETYSGEKPTVGRSSTNSPLTATFYPIYQGEDQDFGHDYGGPDDEKITDTYSLSKGDPIPDVIQDQIPQGMIKYEPFMVSSSVYGAAIEKPPGMSWSEYISRHGKDVTIPWGAAKRQYFAKLRSEGVPEEDIQRLEKDMLDVYNDLNPGYGNVFGEPPPDVDLEAETKRILGL